MARILIAGVKAPFTTGGQEVLVRTLAAKLKEREHEVDIIELPFSPEPKERILHQMALFQGFDLSRAGGKEVDLLIATKFPSYYITHPRKSIWLVHQHRPLYDLYGSRYSDISDDPRDEQLRRLIVKADEQALQSASYISGISHNVVERLQQFNNIVGEVLYPPLPQGSAYYCKKAKPYILSVGRICSIKRVDLMLKALPHMPEEVTLKIVGKADEPGVMEYLNNEIEKHHLWHRVEFLGRVSDEELLELYAKSMAVYYGPHNEDYGYVTLEAMASSKPVITCNDSGGVLEFVKQEENGVILPPSSPEIGAAVTYLYQHMDKAKAMGERGRAMLEELSLIDAGWDAVIDGLLSPLQEAEQGQVTTEQGAHD